MISFVELNLRLEIEAVYDCSVASTVPAQIVVGLKFAPSPINLTLAVNPLLSPLCADYTSGYSGPNSSPFNWMSYVNERTADGVPSGYLHIPDPSSTVGGSYLLYRQSGSTKEYFEMIICRLMPPTTVLASSQYVRIPDTGSVSEA